MATKAGPAWPSIDPTLLILTALAGGPRHGYGIMVDVKALWGQGIGAGTLYAALGRLEKRGWIQALPGEGRRKPYSLTPQGQAVLRGALTGLSRAASTGLLRLGTR